MPNYSFEEADSCPTNLNGNFYEYSLGCIGWGQATAGTTDYYNGCDTAAASIGLRVPVVGIPNNTWGFQVAYEGVAYTGLAIYDDGLPAYKEYLIASIPALKIDTIYKVTIEVSLADSSRFATDAMGVLFTTYGSPDQYTNGTLVETSQIDYTSYGVISDTTNWVTLSATFMADSAYTSFIIGGFKNVAEMNIVDFNEAHKTGASAAYYYIDNVVVEKLSTTGIASINNINVAKVYPNPFTDHATLIFNNQARHNNTLTIFNVQGQVVQYTDNITTDKVSINRNGLPSGLYYYQLREANNIVARGKLMIS